MKDRYTYTYIHNEQRIENHVGIKKIKILYGLIEQKKYRVIL